MFRTSATVPLHERTVGALAREPGVQEGYMVLNSGRETYLIDEDGRVVHEWRARRNVFVAYLRENGNLVRDGSEEDSQAVFRAGGASGYVEEVTWDGELLWRFSRLPAIGFLTHHDIEPLENGNVMLLCWEVRLRRGGLASLSGGVAPPSPADLRLTLAPPLRMSRRSSVWRRSARRRRRRSPRAGGRSSAPTGRSGTT